MKKSIVVVTAVFASLVLICTPALAGSIVIKGSTTVLPIAQKVVEAYMAAHPETKISLSGGGSSNGIKALIDSSTDVANASRFIKDKEVKMAVDRGVYPVPFAVAYDSIIPIVHPPIWTRTTHNYTMHQFYSSFISPYIIFPFPKIRYKFERGLGEG